MMVQLSLLMVAGTLGALALFVWRAGPGSPINRRFAAFSISAGFWTLGVAGFQSAAYVGPGFRLAFASASLFPAALLAFVHAFSGEDRWPLSIAVRTSTIIGVALSIVSLTTPLIVYDAELTEAGLSRKAGPLYSAFALYFLGVWAWALIVLVSKWRRSRGQLRLQLQYLALAIGGAAGGGITSNLLLPLVTGRSTYSWTGPYSTLVAVALLAHAIIRHRLMVLRLVVHRGLTLTIAIIMSLLPVLAVLGLLWPRLSSHLAANELAILLLAITAVTLLAPPTRDLAGRFLDKYVYRAQVDYQRMVRDASRALTRVLRLDVVLSHVAHAVEVSTHCEGVAVYLAAEGGAFRAGAGIEARYASVDRSTFVRSEVSRRSNGGQFEAPEAAPATVVTALTT